MQRARAASLPAGSVEATAIPPKMVAAASWISPRGTRSSTLDTSTPAIRVQAGASIDQVLRHILPHGFWLPVVPGTRQVTVGGAIAADVHGKNHHVDGSFGSHVLTMDLLLASGEVVTLTPGGSDADLFWATVGGMGLTGIVLEATIALKQVETSYFVVDTVKVPNLDELLETLSSGDDDYTYSVAWFDNATSGGALGRSVVTRGNSARLDDLEPGLRAHALDFAAPQRGRIPFTPPVGLVNPLTARAFNAAWFAKAPRHRTGEVQDITKFFHPLDIMGDWNRVYGRRGFVQYQFAVPFGEESTFTGAVQTLAASGHVSWLNVLKRFGPANDSPMSFPLPGWTLAVDLPVRPGLDVLLAHLDELVVAAGGRVYLAKDARTSSSALQRMYPRLDDFRTIRQRVDPAGLFRSDLSRRLDL